MPRYEQKEVDEMAKNLGVFPIDLGTECEYSFLVEGTEGKYSLIELMIAQSKRQCAQSLST